MPPSFPHEFRDSADRGAILAEVVRAQAPRQVFARRGYGHDGRAVTFTSWDRADVQPWGWINGWFEDGYVFDGYALIHVMEPSWRVAAPVALSKREAA